MYIVQVTNLLEPIRVSSSSALGAMGLDSPLDTIYLFICYYEELIFLQGL